MNIVYVFTNEPTYCYKVEGLDVSAFLMNWSLPWKNISSFLFEISITVRHGVFYFKILKLKYWTFLFVQNYFFILEKIHQVLDFHSFSDTFRQPCRTKLENTWICTSLANGKLLVKVFFIKFKFYKVCRFFD